MAETLRYLPTLGQPTPRDLFDAIQPWVAFASGDNWDGGMVIRGTGMTADEPLLQLKDVSGNGAIHVTAADNTLRLYVGNSGVDVGGPLTANSTVHVTGVLTGSTEILTGVASPGIALSLTAGDLRAAAGNLLIGNPYGLYAATTTPGVYAALAAIDSSNNVVLGSIAYDTNVYGLSTVLYDHAAVAQLTIPSGGTAGVRIERLGVATGPNGSHELDVSGSAQISNGLTINSGGMGVTGNSIITGAVSLLGDVQLGIGSSNKVGFYGSAGITRSTVTGAITGSAVGNALKLLCQILGSLNLVVDGTT